MERVTDAQIARMATVVELLATRGNAAAAGMAKTLTGKSLAQQRPLLLGFYATLFEALSSMQMAMNSERTPEDVVAKANAAVKTELPRGR